MVVQILKLWQKISSRHDITQMAEMSDFDLMRRNVHGDVRSRSFLDKYTVNIGTHACVLTNHMLFFSLPF